MIGTCCYDRIDRNDGSIIDRTHALTGVSLGIEHGRQEKFFQREKNILGCAKFEIDFTGTNESAENKKAGRCVIVS